jgi:hypothetical protein
MIRRTGATLLLLAVVCVSNGCGVGTIMNLAPPAATGIGLDENKARRPYGGVLFDAEMMAELTALDMMQTISPDPHGGGGSGKEMLLVALLTLDLPICAVLDTVTLPLTVYWTANRLGKSMLDALRGSPTEPAPADGSATPPASPQGS